MPDLREVKKRVMVAMAVLVAVDLVAVGLLFSPWIGSEQSRRAQLDQLWRELQVKTKEVEPLRGLDKKIPAAQKEIADFYNDRLAATDSEIFDDLGKLATDSGVKIGQIKYDVKSSDANTGHKLSVLDPETVGLKRVEIQADFSGGYLQLARFINSMERSHLFFIVNSVELGGQQAGEVKLQIKAETYLRAGVA